MDSSDVDVEIANIVGSGDLEIEIDLAVLASSSEFVDHSRLESVEHSRRKGNRLLIHFTETDALGILAPSGTYVITGASSFDELHSSRDFLLEVLSEIGIIDDAPDDGGFQVQNLVCIADVGTELDLNKISLLLGLEKTEYEPEQFPGLVYRPDETSCTVLLFATGKIVVTGAKSMEEADTAFNNVKAEVTV